MKCKVEGCERKVEMRKKQHLCEMHFYRLRRHGDVNKRLRNANGEGGLRNGYFRYSEDGERVHEHIKIAEKVLGRPLPKGAVVHHWDEDKMNNAPANLAIFPGQGYHNIIHGRMKAYAATGDASAKPCRHCRKYDAVTNLVKNGTSHYHKACASLYNKERKSALKKGV